MRTNRKIRGIRTIRRYGGGGVGIPYSDLLSRNLLFTTSTDIIDQVGDETRTLIPDRCVTSDGYGGGVYLGAIPLLNNATKWAVAIRLKDYTPILYDFIIGGSTSRNIGLYKSGNVFLKDSTGTFISWDGTANSQEVLGVNIANSDLLFYTDGVNVHLYVDGVYKGYITPATTELYVAKLINGYSFNGVAYYIPKTKNFDYRIWDLSARTQQEIADYFAINAPLFHTDTMANDDNFKYHRWLLMDKDGFVALDSGTADTKVHGTYFYDDVTVPVNTLHNTTLFPITYKNPLNKEGWNLGAYFAENAGQINYGNPYTMPSKLIISMSIIFNRFANFEYIAGHGKAGTDSTWGWTIRTYSPNLYIDFNTETGRFVAASSGYLIGVNEFISIIDLNTHTAYNYLNGVKSPVITFTGDLIDVLSNLLCLGRTGALSSTYFDGFIFDFKLSSSVGDTTTYENAKSQISGNLLNDTLNGSTIGTATNVDFQKILIPNVAGSTFGNGVDVFGRTALYSGIAKMNAEIVGGMVAEFGGSKNIVINFSKPLSATWFIEGFNYMNTVTNYAAILGSAPSRFLSGTGTCILLTDNYGSQNVGSGTVIPAFNSNSVNYWKIESLGNGNIEITINEITVIRTYNLTDSFIITTIGYSVSLGSTGLAHNGIYTNFNNEQIYYYNGHAINSVDGIAATNNGVTFEDVTDFTPQSTVDLLANKKYIDGSGNIIINPQYAKTTETELAAGYFDWQAYGVDDPFFLSMNPQDVEIGEIAMQFFDMDAYVGNVTGKAEIHPVEILTQDFYDASYPFYWTSEAFEWVKDNVADYPTEYQGFIYWLIKSGQFKNIVAYSPQRSSAENTKINQKGFLPQYTEL